MNPNQPSLGNVPKQTTNHPWATCPNKPPTIPAQKTTKRYVDQIEDARDDLDAREVEVDSDEEADARDDLDAHAVLAVELVEEVVVLLLELGLRCVMYVTVRLMRMMSVEAGQLVAERKPRQR
jgi:hypothetical protein